MSEDQRDIRRRKLKMMVELGFDPHPDRFDVSHRHVDAAWLPDGETARVAGRILTIRRFGKLNFATLLDRSGTIQVSFEKGVLSDAGFTLATKLLETGDLIGVTGERWTPKSKEPTLRARSITPLAKCLEPMPEKYHGLNDIEICRRQRHLDLLSNPSTRDRFILRSRVVSAIRRFLDDHGFLEVETPMLQAAASGAAAKPFVTRHDALGRDFFLRISPETYLKRLIVGGLERVYEIGKNFRNEGIDPSHLQEFTMLECYAAYWNYRDNMRLVRELIQALLVQFNGSTRVTYQGIDLDFGGDWPEVSFIAAVRNETGIDLDTLRTRKALAAAISRQYPDIDCDAFQSYPALVDGLYKAVVRPKLIQPTFLVHHPSELVPLARRNAKEEHVLDMFQVVVNTWEIVKAYSELTDPDEQQRRMVSQQIYRSQGDQETMMMEEDYIQSMKYGMPPNSGLGMGIDRLLCLMTDTASLKDVVLFPMMRGVTDSVET